MLTAGWRGGLRATARVLLCLAIAATLVLAPAEAARAQTVSGSCQARANGNIGAHYARALDYALGPGVWVGERAWLYRYESATWIPGVPEFNTYLTDNWLYPSTTTVGGADRMFSPGPDSGHYALYIEFYLHDGQRWVGPTGSWVTFEAGGIWCRT